MLLAVLLQSAAAAGDVYKRQEQDCNAYDAEKSGAGIISSDFNLQQFDYQSKETEPVKDDKHKVSGLDVYKRQALELLVAFIQAYVLTRLSAVFIGVSRTEERREEKEMK